MPIAERVTRPGPLVPAVISTRTRPIVVNEYVSPRAIKTFVQLDTVVNTTSDIAHLSHLVLHITSIHSRFVLILPNYAVQRGTSYQFPSALNRSDSSAG